MDSPFRFGLIGAGAVATIHVLAMRTVPGVEVVAVADPDTERAKTLAERHGIPEVYESAEALLAGAAVDAVAVLTPHHLHLPAVVAAARAGRHVLVEKAIAPSLDAADRMIEACRRHGVTLGGVFQNRFSPAGQALRAVVRDGRLGRVFLASITVKVGRSAEYYRGAPWRGRLEEAGGGVLMVQAIHTLDLLQWVLGMPRRVLARTATAVHPVAVEDLAAGLLELAGGAIAVLQATTAAVPEIPPELELHGDRGSAVVFDSRGYLGFWSSTRDRPTPLPARWQLYAEGFHEQEPTAPSQASADLHAAQIADFVAAVREGRPPAVDGTEARKALVIVDALYRSAQSEDWVAISGGDA
jgi:UDP-N-acetyl-2-amino-2-deoxyglucuronate dehydrogenase